MGRRKQLLLGASLSLVITLGVLRGIDSRHGTPTSASPAAVDSVSAGHAFFQYAGSLDQMVNGADGFKGADLIVRARVLGASVSQAPLSDAPAKPGRATRPELKYTTFTVSASDILPQPGAQPLELSVRMMGANVAGNVRVVDDLPLLVLGREYLLFLRRLDDGRYSILGGNQGYFEIVGDQVEPVAKNAPAVGELRGKDFGSVAQQIGAVRRKN